MPLIINTIFVDSWCSCKAARWSSNSIPSFFKTVIIYSTVLTKTVYASLVWYDCIQNSHSIQGNAHPQRRQHVSSPIRLDLKKSELGLTHFNFIPVVFILLQDPCSVKRSWWHWHWSLRKEKNTKRSSEKQCLRSDFLLFYVYEGHKSWSNVLQRPSLFLLPITPQITHVCGRKGLQSPHNSVLKEQKERETSAELLSLCSLPVQPKLLGTF